MADTDPVALTAIIISVIALLATFGQLLQQYFATADGYRRCLPSVMGDDWGRKTRKRMRWRELRFETLYYVPKISIDLIDEVEIDYGRTEGGIFGEEWRTFDLARKFALGAEEKTVERIREDDREEVATGFGEKVCWLSLLDRLRMAQGDVNSVYSPSLVQQEQRTRSYEPDQMPSTPAIVCMRILKRSWDFMPSEVVRPLCMSTISDIALLVIRLDMNWKEFNPLGGTLIAEGAGQLINSRIVRSLGLCLEYTRSDRLIRGVSSEILRVQRSTGDLLLNAYLPVCGMADLVFGIVPGNKNLKCFDRAMGTLDQITDFLDFLDSTGSTNLRLKQHLLLAAGEKPGWIPGFNDVLPLTAAKMSSVTSNLRNLPMPNTYSAGLLRTREGLQVFCQRLHHYINQRRGVVTEQLLQVQRRVLIFESKYVDFWYANDSAWAWITPYDMVSPLSAYQAREQYQKEIHHALDEAEGFLIGINTDPLGSIRSDRKVEKFGFCYDTLLVEHLRMAIMAYGKTLSDRKETKETPSPLPWSLPAGRNWLYESMHLYWEDLPGVSERVAEYTGCEAELAIDAWITMIFRAFCWHHCHHLTRPKMVLPSEWHGSQMPVYIG